MPIARTSLLAKADFLSRNPGARLGPRLSPRPSSTAASTWHGFSGRNYSAVVKAPGAPIPADSVVIAVRRDAAGRTVLLAAETFEADAPAGFAAFPRIAHLRDEAIAALIETRAAGLRGLQAKAKALLSDVFGRDAGDAAEIARSLARDLTGASQRVIEPRPDPIHEAIAESRRLMRAWDAANQSRTPPALRPTPEWEAAAAAWHDHARTILLKTVPTTAQGCAALARYAAEHHAEQGFALDEDDPHALQLLALIARSPLL